MALLKQALSRAVKLMQNIEGPTRGGEQQDLTIVYCILQISLQHAQMDDQSAVAASPPSLTRIISPPFACWCRPD